MILQLHVDESRWNEHKHKHRRVNSRNEGLEHFKAYQCKDPGARSSSVVLSRRR